MCLGIESWAAEWKAQTNPLSYSAPHTFYLSYTKSYKSTFAPNLVCSNTPKINFHIFLCRRRCCLCTHLSPSLSHAVPCNSAGRCPPINYQSWDRCRLPLCLFGQAGAGREASLHTRIAQVTFYLANDVMDTCREHSLTS